MKAKYLLMMLFASVVSFVSCGGGDDSSDKPNPEETSSNSEQAGITITKEWRITKITRVTEAGNSEAVYDIRYDSKGRVSEWNFNNNPSSVITWDDSGIKSISDGYTIKDGLISMLNGSFYQREYTYAGGYKVSDKTSGWTTNEYTYTWEAGLITSYKYSYSNGSMGSAGSYNYIVEYGDKVWPEKTIGPLYSMVVDIDGLYGKHPYLFPKKKIEAIKNAGGTEYILDTEYDYTFNENGLLVEWVEKSYDSSANISSTVTYTLEWSQLDVEASAVNNNSYQPSTPNNPTSNNSDGNSGTISQPSLNGTSWQCTWTAKLSGYTIKYVDTYRFSETTFSWTETSTGGPAGRSTQTTSGTYYFDGSKITTINTTTGKSGTLIYHDTYLEHTGTGRSYQKL